MTGFLTSFRPKHYIILGGISFILFIVYALTAPRYGSIYYGICKTYVEMNVDTPQTLEFFEIEPGETNLRLSYAIINGYGQRSLNLVDCRFKLDDDGNLTYELESVNVNRDRVHPLEEAERVRRFNLGIPAILAHPPDLRLPPNIPTDLKDMKE